MHDSCVLDGTCNPSSLRSCQELRISEKEKLRGSDMQVESVNGHFKTQKIEASQVAGQG